MAYDMFERKYEDEISWETERILGDSDHKEEDYDVAYEEAVDNIAAAKGITLV